ncbi:hypothetical protein DBR06_SOUSAS310012, partial [Sousa chinensis]
PTLILSTSRRSPNSNMNWRPTRRTPIHNCRPISIHLIFSLNP